MNGDERMPFKSKFSKEDIINAAFEIAEEQGLQAITARTVAKKINGSVAPIYFNFENIDELIRAVVMKVFSITQKIMNAQSSNSIYENMGRAGFEFANRYPVFFRDLVLQPNPYIKSYEQTEDAMLQSLDHDPKTSTLSIIERKHLILKMKALQIGFQTLIANDQIPSWITKDEVEELFINLGYQILDLQFHNGGKNEKNK